MECADVGFVVDVSSSVMGYYEKEKDFVNEAPLFKFVFWLVF